MFIKCGYCQSEVKKKNYLKNHTTSGFLFCNKKCKDAYYGYNTPEFIKIKEDVRKLRKSGLSYQEIKHKLNLTVAIGSIARYCKGINIHKKYSSDTKQSICGKCGQEFSQNIKRYRKYCKVCRGSKVYHKDGELQKYCKLCDEYVNIDNFYKSKNNKPLTYCIKCSAKRLYECKKQLKQLCIDYKGGKCIKCNTSYKSTRVYDFHHREPHNKDFAISSCKNYYKPKLTDELKQELDKCDLLCANCHRMLHEEEDITKYK